MVRSVFLGTALVLVGLGQFSANAEFVPTRHSAVVISAWYACQQKDDLQFLKGLSQKQWAEANGFAKAHNCKVLHVGDVWTVDNSSIWTHDTCLQLDDRGTCFWFPETFVKRHEPKN
jgi:hypothetical protein